MPLQDVDQHLRNDIECVQHTLSLSLSLSLSLFLTHSHGRSVQVLEVLA